VTAKTRYSGGQMPGWIGFPELLILLVVVLLVFGPKRLPEMGRSLGKGMREFKDSITGNDEPPAQLPPATAHDTHDATVTPTPSRENEPVS
jgi:sec-independent protein translocase protein TatA